MRIIQKQISLEPMTSRLPSVWPAYYDNKHYFFDDASLKEREWLYTSNWGMVPDNIVVTPKPYSSHTSDEYQATSGCHCYGKLYETNSGCSNCGSSSYDELCDFVLSFENLSKWYYFFNEYYNLLKQYSHCDRVYTSAEDYYNYESLTKYADQMIYGTDKQTYLDLDEEFANKGGRVYVDLYNKDKDEDPIEYKLDLDTYYKKIHDEYEGDRTAIINVYDGGFFKWICDNVVPSFTIPMAYRNYWKKDMLFYPDVIKWMKWFNDREDLNYEEAANFELEREITEIWDCKAEGVDDCCDCEEYFNRGGERIYSAMSEWYSTIQKNIFSSITESCLMPTVILPTELQVSIDDLGEFSIFSKDYELGEDYRVAHYGDSANTYGGTVAVMDGKSVYLSEDELGYTFDEDYMEKNVSSAWTSYTEKYIDENKNDFYTTVHFYTYDENNVKYVSVNITSGEAVTDLAEQLSKKYPITKRENGWLLIDDILYPIEQSEFCSGNSKNAYLSGNTYLVFHEEGTNTPYTFVNGKKIFAEFYPPTNQFYFTMFTKPDAKFEKRCSGEVFNINNYQTFERFTFGNYMFYVEYNGIVYNLGIEIPSTFEIDGIEYYTVSGYAETENGETLYIIDNSVKHFSKNVNGVLEDYTIDGYNDPIIENDIIKITPLDGDDFIFPLYRVDEITGQTVSKLNDIRLYNVLTDDIGNTIEGIYDLRSSGATNHQPPQGTELELIYQVGNTANITRFSQTKEDMNEIIVESDNEDEWRNYFVGDIITNMTFYYKDYDGNIVEDTIFHTLISANTDQRAIIDNSGKTITTSGYTSLRAIQEATNVKNELERKGSDKEIDFIQEDIFCDITYYVGATLVREKDKPYNLAFDDSKSKKKLCSNYGVEYRETVKFVKTNWEYYLKTPKDGSKTLPSEREKPCKHSVSYPIYVYVLTQDMKRVDESQYDMDYSVPMSEFRFDINIFSCGTNGDSFSQKYSGDMESHNGMEVYPTFREEYRFGISSLENIDSDIYIDRGINAAFEKHLKLGEVASLEALEQYGNGYFKIMES